MCRRRLKWKAWEASRCLLHVVDTGKCQVDTGRRSQQACHKSGRLIRSSCFTNFLQQCTSGAGGVATHPGDDPDPLHKLVSGCPRTATTWLQEMCAALALDERLGMFHLAEPCYLNPRTPKPRELLRLDRTTDRCIFLEGDGPAESTQEPYLAHWP